MSSSNAIVTTTGANTTVRVTAGQNFSVDLASLFPGADPASVHAKATAHDGQAITNSPDWRFAVWGDSVATGAGVSDLSQSWRTTVPKSFSPDATLHMGAFGGATTTGATAAFDADSNAAAHRSAINLFWTGHNDADVDQTIAGLKEMIGQLTGEQHYLILLPMQGTGLEMNSFGYLKIVEEAQAIRAAFPAANIVDIQAAMTAAAPDDPGVAQGRVPLKFLADIIHPNAAGQAVIAQAVEAAIKANGWTGAGPSEPTWVGNETHGTLAGTATSAETGTYTLTVTAKDATGHTVTKTVSLVVDDSPVTTAADHYATAHGTVLRANVLANDTTTAGSTTAALVDGPDHGHLTFKADGSFTYVADANYTGGDSFTYKAVSGGSTSEATAVSLAVGSHLDTVTVRVAADSYAGNPHFGILVDGKVAGFGVATASHANGEWQDITLTGDFGGDASKIQVVYENDRYEGADKDRNLYVDHLDFNGVRYEGEEAQLQTHGWRVDGAMAIGNAGALVFDTHAQTGTVLPTPAPATSTSVDTVPDTAVLDTPVEAGRPSVPIVETLPTAPSSPAVEIPSVSVPASSAPTSSIPAGAITLRVSEDAFHGHAQFVVTVDGQQVGDVQTVTASRAAGEHQDIMVQGSFSNAPGHVAVQFLNDLYAGSADQDRNLYVETVSVNGHVYNGADGLNTAGPNSGAGAALLNDWGKLLIDTSSLAASAAGSDTLSLRVSEDAYKGHAQFIVTVDGQQVGSVQTVTASHVAGDSQDITIHGTFGASPGSVAVHFINDLYEGSAGQDRNLWVDSLTMNGHSYEATHAVNTAGYNTADAALLMGAGPGGNGALTFDMLHV